MNELKETKCTSSVDICPKDSIQDVQRTTAEEPNQPGDEMVCVKVDNDKKVSESNTQICLKKFEELTINGAPSKPSQVQLVKGHHNHHRQQQHQQQQPQQQTHQMSNQQVLYCQGNQPHQQNMCPPHLVYTSLECSGYGATPTRHSNDRGANVDAGELPLHDPATLSFFYQLGLEHYRMTVIHPPPSITRQSIRPMFQPGLSVGHTVFQQTQGCGQKLGQLQFHTAKPAQKPTPHQTLSDLKVNGVQLQTCADRTDMEKEFPALGSNSTAPDGRATSLAGAHGSKCDATDMGSVKQSRKTSDVGSKVEAGNPETSVGCLVADDKNNMERKSKNSTSSIDEGYLESSPSSEGETITPQLPPTKQTRVPTKNRSYQPRVLKEIPTRFKKLLLDLAAEKFRISMKQLEGCPLVIQPGYPLASAAEDAAYTRGAPTYIQDDAIYTQGYLQQQQHQGQQQQDQDVYYLPYCGQSTSGWSCDDHGQLPTYPISDPFNPSYGSYAQYQFTPTYLIPAYGTMPGEPHNYSSNAFNPTMYYPSYPCES